MAHVHVTPTTPAGTTVRVIRTGSHGYPHGSLFDLVLVTDAGLAIVKTGHDSRGFIPIAHLEVVA